MLLLIITYIAGILTILSPCILPVIPFVFASSQKSFFKSGLPLLAGMALTFSLFSGLALASGEWISQANEYGRWIAIIILTLLGLSLIFPSYTEKILFPLTRMGSKIGQRSNQENPKGSFIIGISTGLLWAPCAGPILGLVLTGAASQGNKAIALSLLVAYSLGACTSLALALWAGKRFFQTLKKFLKADHLIKKGLGIAVLVGVAIIALNLDRTFLTQISQVKTTDIENKLLSTIRPTEKKSLLNINPDYSGARAWINSKALSQKDLLGHVVLVDFWTYSCINCLRSLPYVKAWSEKYKDQGLIVIGVHTPEFAFEKNLKNVESAVQDLKLIYPIAIDNDYKIWNSFQNEYWPAHYFFDRDGKLRHYHFGEGDYEKSEKIIQDLLANTSATSATVQAQGVQAASSLGPTSAETYLGYDRVQNFAGIPVIQKDRTTFYKAPQKLSLHKWSLQGSWLISEEKAVLQKPGGKIMFRFQGRDLHLVLGSSKKIKFKVRLNGEAPKNLKGLDVDVKGLGEIKEHRLYQLIRLEENKDNSDALFEIEFLDSGAEAYAFTFG